MEKRIGFEMRKLNNLIKRDIEHSKFFQYAQSTGLHGWAIGYFYENRDRDVFQRDFEEKFSIRRSTASKMLALMEKNGLIVRQSVDYDARLKKIVLTERAIELHQNITEEIAAREERMTRGLTEEELERFYQVLEKIGANLEEENV